MILNPGDLVLVSNRRLFAEDQPRFFAGRVEEWQAGMVAATGYAWTRDPVAGGYQRKEDARTKIFAISSGALLVYRLPKEIELEKLRIERADEHALYLVDDARFRMDLSERVPHRAPHSRAS